jgi:hypothetical protein
MSGRLPYFPTQEYFNDYDEACDHIVRVWRKFRDNRWNWKKHSKRAYIETLDRALHSIEPARKYLDDGENRWTMYDAVLAWLSASEAWEKAVGAEWTPGAFDNLKWEFKPTSPDGCRIELLPVASRRRKAEPT